MKFIIPNDRSGKKAWFFLVYTLDKYRRIRQTISANRSSFWGGFPPSDLMASNFHTMENFSFHRKHPKSQ